MNVRIASPGWKKVVGIQKWDVKELKRTSENGLTTITGTIPFAEASVRFREQISIEAEALSVIFELTPQGTVPAEGMFVTVAVPVDNFIEGEVSSTEAASQSAAASQSPTTWTRLPTSRPADEHLMSTRSSGILFRKAARSLAVAFDQPRNVTIQDERRWNNQAYSAYFPIHRGDLVAGQTSRAQLLFRPTTEIDHVPVVLGVDTQAWQYSGVFRDYAYAFSEARQYQELLLYARPRGIILWEYSSDYGLETLEGGRIVPMKRFYFIRQFATITPRNGENCVTTSSSPRVLFTAIRAEDGAMCLHILNDGAAREANLSGIPSGQYRCCITDRLRDSADVSTPNAQGGKASLSLPAWSLVTLKSQ